jgi:hypothetical protein
MDSSSPSSPQTEPPRRLRPPLQVLVQSSPLLHARIYTRGATTTAHWGCAVACSLVEEAKRREVPGAMACLPVREEVRTRSVVPPLSFGAAVVPALCATPGVVSVAWRPPAGTMGWGDIELCLDARGPYMVRGSATLLLHLVEERFTWPRRSASPKPSMRTRGPAMGPSGGGGGGWARTQRVVVGRRQLRAWRRGRGRLHVWRRGRELGMRGREEGWQMRCGG